MSSGLGNRCESPGELDLFQIAGSFLCLRSSLGRLFQLLAYKLRAVDFRHLPFREIAQQSDSARIDEPHFFEIETHVLLLGEGFIAEPSQLFDPGAYELAFQLKLDGLV